MRVSPLRFRRAACPGVAAFILACILPPLAVAQTATVQGVVRAADGLALPGVNVFLEGTTQGAATDLDGRYQITGLPPGAYTLIASVVGFRRESRALTLSAGQVLDLDFTLTEVVLESGEVVITASRRAQLATTVPASISVMGPRELEVRNVVALDDALHYIPGLQLMEDQVNIRGSSGFAYNVGSRVLLLIDGLPMLTPASDGVPFHALPIAQIAQIEVLKGPGSALYGSGALGGVIQVVTKPYPEVPETSVRLFGGGYEPTRYRVWRNQWQHGNDVRLFGGATFTHARRFGQHQKTGMWVNLAYRNDPGYLNFNKEEAFHGYLKFGVRPRPTLQLDVLAGVVSRTSDNFLFWNGARDALNPGRLALGSADTPTGTNDLNNNQVSLLPSLTHVVNSRLFYTLKARLFGSIIYSLDENFNRRPLEDGTLGFRYGGEVQVNYTPRANAYLTAGASFDANTTASSFFLTNDGDDLGNQPEGALFAQWEQPLGPLNVVAGLRFDTYGIDAAETIRKLSPKLSAAYPIGENLSIRAAYGQGFRVPSLAERFTDNQDFFPIFRNLEIRPEESTSYEVGLHGLFPLAPRSGATLDVALFWNHYTNLIEPKFVVLANPSRVGFQFINLTEARIRGLDASLETAFQEDRLTSILSYTFMASDDLTEEQILVFRPRHLFKASLDARIVGPFTAGFDYRFASTPERVDTDFRRFVPDADFLVDTHVLDLRVGAQLRWLRLGVLLKNATEYYYLERPALLGPPRHLILQLQADF